MIRREWFRASWRVPVAAMLAVAGVAVSLSAADDAVSDLKAAVAALQSKNEAAAIATLKGLSGRLPQIADYVAWFRASAEFSAGNYAAVPAALEPIWAQSPPSPLIGRAALLGAQAFGTNSQTRHERRQSVAQVLRRVAAAARRLGAGQSFRGGRRSRERGGLCAARVLRLSGCERVRGSRRRWRRVWSRNLEISIRRPWATPCWDVR